MYETWYPLIVSIIVIFLILSFTMRNHTATLVTAIFGLIFLSITLIEFLDPERYSAFYDKLKAKL